MKRLKDLEISVIKPQNHNSTKELDFILESLNDIIYFFYFLFISKSSKEYIYNKFIEIGQELNTMELTDKQNSRRNEILNTLRKYYKILKDYKPDDDAETIRKMNNFFTSQFLREKRELENKDSNSNDWDTLYQNWLIKTKQFAKYYPVEKCLQSVNQECINYFTI